MSTTKQEKTFNKIVGITDQGTVIMIRSVFNYIEGLHNQPFYGVSYAEFAPITQDYIDERNDLESVCEEYGYLWEEAVKNGDTKESQEDYMQNIIDSNVWYSDSLFLGHDTSYIFDIPDSFKEEYFSDCESFECIGGGRMSSHIKYATVLDQELINIADSFEFGTTPQLSIFKEENE